MSSASAIGQAALLRLAQGDEHEELPLDRRFAAFCKAHPWRELACGGVFVLRESRR